MRKLLIVVTILLWAFPAFAAEHKEPWEWTLDERLAARLVTVRPNAQKPIAAAEAGRASVHGGGTVVEIDGRANPQLFLPHELFDCLLSGFGTDEALAAKQRWFYGRLIGKLGYDEQQFWSTLKQLSGEYLPYATGRGDEQPERRATWSRDRCLERHRALEAARNVYGPREFDRLLYLVVAPSFQFSRASSDGTAADYMDELRKAEEGLCD